MIFLICIKIIILHNNNNKKYRWTKILQIIIKHKRKMKKNINHIFIMINSQKNIKINTMCLLFRIIIGYYYTLNFWQQNNLY